MLPTPRTGDGGYLLRLDHGTTPMSPVLFALAVAAFAIGTTEFVMIGLVPDVARDLTVTISLCVDQIGNMGDKAGLARRNMVGHGVAIGEVTAILRPERDRRVGE